MKAYTTFPAGFFLVFPHRILALIFLVFSCACATNKPAPQKPTIVQIEPASGPTYGGYPLFIIGHGFDSKAQVTIGGKAVDDISLGQLFLVRVPAGSAGKADVVITNPDKKRAVLKEGFVYNLYPSINSVQPGEGSSAGGTEVIIRGAGFVKGVLVRFGGHNADVKSGRRDLITVISPPHSPGAVNVVVTNPGGFSFILEDIFTYR